MRFVMGLATVKTRAAIGLDAPPVDVEVHLANGIPGFHMVGMAETTVKEARDRVRGALINSGFEFPAKRITVNLAPADLPKHGGRYDLPIALGILIASEQLPTECLNDKEIFGELALSGKLRPTPGALPFAIASNSAKKELLLPATCLHEVTQIKHLKHHGFDCLNDVVLFCREGKGISSRDLDTPNFIERTRDWSDIIGQESAKQALLIAAAGEHHLLFVGPPGTGKSLLASKLVQILPEMTDDEAMDVASIRSIMNLCAEPEKRYLRPFRQPHHTCSAIALTGGGTQPKPGEVTLAHHGVLFLDELPEFGRHTLDVLREPLETGSIHISRALGQATYPARFQLVAAMNPSPTGDIHDARCSSDQIMRYLNRLSGPLLDRIDLQIEVPRLNFFPTSDDVESSYMSANKAYEIACQARDKQMKRQGCPNSKIDISALNEICKITPKDMRFLQRAVEKLELSLRGFHRILRVSRTIADLENSSRVQRNHLAQALGYRALDKLLSEFTK